MRKVLRKTLQLNKKREYKVRPIFEEEMSEFRLKGNKTIIMGR